jgi:hypothetical protein
MAHRDFRCMAHVDLKKPGCLMAPMEVIASARCTGQKKICPRQLAPLEKNGSVVHARGKEGK